jgi:hypothetical protein
MSSSPHTCIAHNHAHLRILSSFTKTHVDLTTPWKVGYFMMLEPPTFIYLTFSWYAKISCSSLQLSSLLPLSHNPFMPHSSFKKKKLTTSSLLFSSLEAPLVLSCPNPNCYQLLRNILHPIYTPFSKKLASFGQG